MRHKEANTKESKGASPEEEAERAKKEAKAYVFVFQTPDGRTVQTDEGGSEVGLVMSEELSKLIVGLVIFIRLVGKGLRQVW